MGCDFPGSLFSWFSKGFNPRTRMGCDNNLLKMPLLGILFQSTHPHGVRHPYRLFDTQARGFNPRTRMGCDQNVEQVVDISVFQSTHPHGVRLRSPRCSIIIYFCFNPRTRMGCDCVQLGSRRQTRVSIHAPAWGATLPSKPKRSSILFQSTHPHGVRQPADVILLNACCFNPRTRMGCDLSRTFA